MSGHSVLRAFLNYRLSTEVLQGNVIDIGGGKNEDYISFMKRADNVCFINFDIKAGAHVDFEKDKLPNDDSSFDTVLFLNVMEHIFNYQHIADEVVRVTRSGGQLIGFVPFLMWYHPDHSDYFRYTHESLEKIFNHSSISQINIEPIGAGPFVASSHMFIQFMPRILRPLLFTVFFLTDKVYLSLKKEKRVTHQLGYLFVIKKK
jgi:SAM-dependent methyltransferase